MSRIHWISFLFALVTGASTVACAPAAQPTFPDRRGGRGESCLVTNDCKEPLLCLGGRCLDEKLSFEPTGKVCAAGQCLANADCCPPLSLPEQEYCKTLEAECRD